jgi:hypothetical protein
MPELFKTTEHIIKSTPSDIEVIRSPRKKFIFVKRVSVAELRSPKGAGKPYY